MNKEIIKNYFSIIICCYNSEKFIEETINSINAQTHKFWEIIIINDGSSDNTENIINKFIQKGCPIKYHLNLKNFGFAKSRNIAVNLTKYDWITIIDHDDIMTINRLEVQSKLINKNSNMKFYFGNSEILKNGKIISTRFNNFNLHYKKSLNELSFNKDKLTGNLIRYGCFILSSTVTFHKSCFNINNGFNEKLKFTSDYDFFLRLSKNFDFYCINEIINKWRIHPSQSTIKYKKIHNKELSYLLIKNIFNSKVSFSIKMYGIIKALYYFIKF